MNLFKEIESFFKRVAPKNWEKININQIQFKKENKKIRKRFFYYENERWYFWKGFLSKNLLFERPSLSDLNGNCRIDPTSFALSSDWR